MALTPHSKDPKRKEVLRHQNDLAKQGSEGMGKLKQEFNADAPSKVMDPIADKAAEKEAEAKEKAGDDKAGKKK